MAGIPRSNAVYDELLIPLIRYLAQGGHSQKSICTELNDRGLFRPGTNQARWNQTQLSRYMKQHNITPAWKLTIYPPEQYEKTKNV